MSRRVLVTGGSRGLGLALCQALLADGWRVVTCCRVVSAPLSVLLREYPDHLECHLLDLASPGSIPELARVGATQGLHGFVANAALGTAGGLTLTSEVRLRELIEVNMTAPILLAREVVKGMLEHGGALVFVSSVAARTGLAGLATYSATKGALSAFSRSLAREYGPRGIRSNCVVPGFIETDMSRSLDDERMEGLVRRTPLRRLGSTHDVVGAIRFLLSDDARFMTGTELVIDGGFLA